MYLKNQTVKSVVSVFGETVMLLSLSIMAILFVTPLNVSAEDWSWLPVAGEKLTDYKLLGRSLLDPTPEGSQVTKNKYHKGALHYYLRDGKMRINAFSIENHIYHMQMVYDFREVSKPFTIEALFAELIHRYGEPAKQDNDDMYWEKDDVFFLVKYRRSKATVQLTYLPINRTQIAKARSN